MSKMYSTISVIPGVAKIVDRPEHLEDYSSVDSVTDKSKWIPESQILSGSSMTNINGQFDPPNTTLDTPVPLSRTRGLDPAVLSTHVANEQKVQSKKYNDAVSAIKKQQQRDEVFNQQMTDINN